MRLLHLLILPLFLAGCTLDGFDISTATTTDTTTTPKVFSVENIGSETALPGGYTYQLIKLSDGTNDPTFIEWTPNKLGTKGPAMIITMPYNAISWTGLTVDTTWYNQTPGWYQDVNGPYYDAATSGTTVSTPITPDGIYYQGLPYLYNNISVVMVYGRFYSGADIKRGARDVLNTIKFLKTKTDLVDTTKIGIYGESWGGFMSLYGMAHPENDVTLAAAGFLYPMTDAQIAYDFVKTTVPSIVSDPTQLGKFNTFFDAYERRINKSSEEYAGQANRYRNYNQTAATGVTTPMFIAHDMWDTIVPQTMTASLLTTIPNTEHRHYYYIHTTSLDPNTADVGHTQSSDPISHTMNDMWAQIFVIRKLLGTAVKYGSYDSAAFVTEFQHTRNIKLAGGDTSFYNPLLKELCDTNLTMIDSNASPQPDATGPEILAYLFTNLIAGPESKPEWSSTAANICTLMDSNTPVF